MKFKISREALLKPLQVVSGVVERRQTLPILSNVLLQVSGNQLTLTGSDLEVELVAQTVLDESADEGEITLPAKKLMDLCRALPEGATIEVVTEEERALVRSGKSRFTLSTLSASDFPATEAITGVFEFTLMQRDLKRLIDQTQFCMANQDVRYYLNGLLFEVDKGRLRAVATDGHRLALCDSSAEVDAGVKHEVIIPRKGVVELGRLLQESDATAVVQLNSNHIKVRLDGITLTSKLIDGRFPDYERVVPTNVTRVIVGDRETLRQALSRTAILSNEKYRGIRLQLSAGKLRALVNNPEQEEAEEEVEVAYEGEEFEIGFNVAYLLDALGAVKQEQVSLGMTDANSSCLIHGLDDVGSRYVVMPMRL